MRFDDTGLTLPRLGTLTWDEIASISITNAGFVTRNVWIRAWESLTGSSGRRFVTVRMKDAGAVLARVGTATTPMDGVDLNELHAFRGVWGHGLRSPGWDETVAALQQAATRHGIPLPGREI